MSAFDTRAHIEFIQRQDLPWTGTELVAGAAHVEQKRLSNSANQAAFTAVTRMKAGWQADSLPPRQTACELFMLAGSLRLDAGDAHFELSRGCYLRIEDAQIDGAIRAPVDTECLYMTAIGPEPAPVAKQNAVREKCAFVDSDRIEWEIPWVPGPDPGLKIKLLWRDELTGAYTRLINADPGWTEKRREHHDCVEEVYMISGDMTMGALGTMTAGGYIWRPPGIQHGPMHTRAGGLMFIRTDGPLKNYYTDVGGTPLNY
jgi:hypothetical protein